MSEDRKRAGPGVNRSVFDFAVIGGGIVGAATAYHLARLGADTVLLERGAFGTEASGRNAGTLNIIHERARFDRLPFRQRSIERWRTLSQELDTDLAVELDRGTLLVSEDEPERDRLRELMAGHREYGVAIDWLEGPALRAFAPYLAPDITAALYCPIGGSADPRQAGHAFAQAAARYGATLLPGTDVTAIRKSGGTYVVGPVRAASVLIAAGPWSGALLADLGITLPFRIQYFQASATSPVPPFLYHGLRRVAGMLTLKQNAAGACILGGGWTGISAFPVHGEVSADALAQNRAIAARLVPTFAALDLVQRWAGYDGSSLDGQPILDAIPGHPGLFISTGASTGFSDGPMLGELGADMLLGLTSEHDLSPYTLSRFKATI